jgi:hypothetical protein
MNEPPIIAEIDHPLAVVDGEQYREGVVYHRSLLGALSNNLRRAEKEGDQER